MLVHWVEGSNRHGLRKRDSAIEDGVEIVFAICSCNLFVLTGLARTQCLISLSHLVKIDATYAQMYGRVGQTSPSLFKEAQAIWSLDVPQLFSVYHVSGLFLKRRIIFCRKLQIDSMLLKVCTISLLLVLARGC